MNRLGYNDPEDIKNHEWFANIDWDLCYER